MNDLEYQFKKIVKEAVREVLQEEIEKRAFSVPSLSEQKVESPQPKQFEPRDPDSIIRPKELCEMLSVSLSTLYRWESIGEMPEKVKLSNQAVGWRYKDITEWLGYN